MRAPSNQTGGTIAQRKTCISHSCGLTRSILGKGFLNGELPDPPVARLADWRMCSVRVEVILEVNQIPASQVQEKKNVVSIGNVVE
jgi:hypothetical protein